MAPRELLDEVLLRAALAAVEEAIDGLSDRDAAAVVGGVLVGIALEDGLSRAQFLAILGRAYDADEFAELMRGAFANATAEGDG